VAALTAEWVFPAGLSNRVRGCIGGAVSAVALVMLIFAAGSTAGLVVLLGVAGLGLGVFVPANNVVIMRSAAADSPAVLGGLVNMARGIGTTFGIALVTLALHLSGSGHSQVAWTVLAVAAGCAAVVAMSIRPGRAARLGRETVVPVPAAGVPDVDVQQDGRQSQGEATD